MRFVNGGVGRFSQKVEHGQEGRRSQGAAGQDDRLATNAVRQRAEEQEAACTQDQRPSHHHVGRKAVDLDDVLHEEQSVELAGVPNHSLTRHQTQQSDQGDLAVFPVAKGFTQRRLGGAAFFLHLFEGRAFVHLQADVQGNRQQEDGANERNTPAPCIECLDHGGVAVGHEHGHAVFQQRHVGVVAVDIALHRQNDDQ